MSTKQLFTCPESFQGSPSTRPSEPNATPHEQIINSICVSPAFLRPAAERKLQQITKQEKKQKKTETKFQQWTRLTQPTLGCSVARVMSMKEPSSSSRGCMCIRVQKSWSFLDRGGWALFQTILVCGPRCSISVLPLLYLLFFVLFFGVGGWCFASSSSCTSLQVGASCCRRRRRRRLQRFYLRSLPDFRRAQAWFRTEGPIPQEPDVYPITRKAVCGFPIYFAPSTTSAIPCSMKNLDIDKKLMKF